MTREYIKITALVVLGAFAAGVLFLMVFRYFKPLEKLPTGTETLQEGMISDDPESSLYVSRDGGETWRGIAGARFSPFHLLFDTKGNQLFVGSQEAGIWTVDTGEFSRAEQYKDKTNRAPATATVFSMEFDDAVSPSTVYAAVRHDDRGYLAALKEETYTELFFAPLEDSPVRTTALDPFSPTRIFIGAGAALYRTDDAGETWQVLHNFGRTVTYIRAHPRVPGLLFAATDRGHIFRTSDYGNTWQELTKSIAKHKGARENQKLFLGASSALYLVSNHGLLISRNNGDDWDDIPLLAPPDSLPVLGFAMHPENSAMFYISASSQLYKTDNGGVTWKGTQFPGKSSIIAIAIDPADPKTIIIGFEKESPSRKFFSDN